MGGVLNPDGVAAYDFDIFADTLLPFTRAELEEMRRQRGVERMHRDSVEQAQAVIAAAALGALSPTGQRKRSSGRRFSSSQLAWDRLEDLRALIKLRGFERGLPAGERNKYMFLAAVFLAQSSLVVDLMSEFRELAREFAPAWTDVDLERCASSVFSRAELAAKGRKVELEGREIDPRYRFSNKGLVQWLDITPDEAAKLKCMLSREESARRNTERLRKMRRSEGAMERADYRARAASRRDEAKAMAKAGVPRASIAERLQVTKRAVDGYLKVEA